MARRHRRIDRCRRGCSRPQRSSDLAHATCVFDSLRARQLTTRWRCHPTCHTGCGRRFRVGPGMASQLGAAEVDHATARLRILARVRGPLRERGCGQQDLDTSRSHTIIGPPLDELEQLAAAPPMFGAERAMSWGCFCQSSEMQALVS